MGSSHHDLATLRPGKGPVPILQEAMWAPGCFWKSVENLCPTGIQSTDHSASVVVVVVVIVAIVAYNYDDLTW